MKPIYCTNGEWVALVKGMYIYDTRGEWIAWLDGKDVYTHDGFYAGFLSDDNRILRHRIRKNRQRRVCPEAPARLRPPASVALAPLFAELPWHIIDCFAEEPEVFTHISDLHPDWGE